MSKSPTNDRQDLDPSAVPDDRITRVSFRSGNEVSLLPASFAGPYFLPILFEALDSHDNFSRDTDETARKFRFGGKI